MHWAQSHPALNRGHPFRFVLRGMHWIATFLFEVFMAVFFSLLFMKISIRSSQSPYSECRCVGKGWRRGWGIPLTVSGDPVSSVEGSLAKQYLMSCSLGSGPVKASGSPWRRCT